MFGPIVRDADDLELLLGVLAGPEPERELAWRVDLPAPGARSLADYRIGTWFNDPGCRVSRASGALLAGAADRIADAGAKVEEAHPAVDFPAQVGLFNQLIVAAISPSLSADIAEAMSGTHLAWLQADEERAQLRAKWAEWFAEFDVLLCPVMPVAAIQHDQSDDMMTRTVEIDGETRSYLELIGWTGLIGVVGLPSVVVPIGRTDEGLPVGMQIVSPFLHDRRSVHVAQLARDVLGGYEPPPGFGP